MSLGEEFLSLFDNGKEINCRLNDSRFKHFEFGFQRLLKLLYGYFVLLTGLNSLGIAFWFDATRI